MSKSLYPEDDPVDPKVKPPETVDVVESVLPKALKPLAGATSFLSAAAADPKEKVDFLGSLAGGPCPNENAGLSPVGAAAEAAPNEKPPACTKKL